jgi:hypothetical protein
MHTTYHSIKTPYLGANRVKKPLVCGAMVIDYLPSLIRKSMEHLKARGALEGPCDI